MVVECRGAVVPWCRGAVVPWCRGAVVPWCLGTSSTIWTSSVERKQKMNRDETRSLLTSGKGQSGGVGHTVLSTLRLRLFCRRFQNGIRRLHLGQWVNIVPGEVVYGGRGQQPLKFFV
jgi:hypothetical protein